MYVARQFELSAMAITMNTDGMTHEESLATPRPAGNNANWVFGHIITVRNQFVPILGLEPFQDEARTKLYDRGTPAVTAVNAAPFAELVESFGRSQEQIMGALENVDFDKPAPKSLDAAFFGKTLGSALLTFAFHEIYHSGQLGILRRIAGKDGAIQ